jgi:hypothetical protein
VYLKAIDRILWLTYGNHGSSKDKREDAEVVLEALSNGGVVSRSELMQRIGLSEDTNSDVDEFNSVLRPLKGTRKGSPFPVQFVCLFTRDGDVYLKLSEEAFSATWSYLRMSVLKFIENQHGRWPENHQVLDQLVWMAYANHSNTYQHRQNAQKVLKHLFENGETSKQVLMRVSDYEYGDENDDQSFRGMMKYLRASWKDEEDAKNPLHTSNHGFLVRQEMQGQTAYYSLCPGEFKRTMNVVAANIRSFL